MSTLATLDIGHGKGALAPLLDWLSGLYDCCVIATSQFGAHVQLKSIIWKIGVDGQNYHSRLPVACLLMA